MALKKSVVDEATHLIMGDYINFRIIKEERQLRDVFELQEQDKTNENGEIEKIKVNVKIGEEEVFHYWVTLRVFASEFDKLSGAAPTMTKNVEIHLPYRPEGYSIGEKYTALKEQIPEFNEAIDC